MNGHDHASRRIDRTKRQEAEGGRGVENDDVVVVLDLADRQADLTP